jgi:hypothetical protein
VEALDAKFIPSSPALHLETWTSYVAWADKDPGPPAGWRITVTPELVLPRHPRDVPPLRASDDADCRAWLSLLAHNWLTLIDARGTVDLTVFPA